jgi:hypothetical protein
MAAAKLEEYWHQLRVANPNLPGVHRLRSSVKTNDIKGTQVTARPQRRLAKGAHPARTDRPKEFGHVGCPRQIDVMPSVAAVRLGDVQALVEVAPCRQSGTDVQNDRN